MNPFKRKSEHPDQSVVLDTSGIIDGRIVHIAQAGFVPTNVVVPQFVIAELQFLADHGDTHKRERARYGLDVIRELQEVRRIDVTIARDKFERIREVDDKLVALAKRYGSYLYTTDFNLNKVAQIEGVSVLNVNELAHALRPNLLPGERVIIKLTQVGQDRTQGVGYLSDGTMVVVEQGSRYVGQQVQAVCTRILQTQAGKMMFATISHDSMAQLKPTQPDNKPKEQSKSKTSIQTLHAKRHDGSRRQAGHHEQSAGSGAKQQPAIAQHHDQAAPQRVYHARPRRHAKPDTQPRSNDEATKKPIAKKPEATKPTAVERSSKAANTRQNSKQRSSRSPRRHSAEDSLLATLKEIQD